MNALTDAFNERLAEVETYLDLLTVLEERAQSGPPKFVGAEQNPITTQQQKILYSSVYIQLYNLVESTMTRCVNAIAEAAMKNSAWRADDLCSSLQTEWIKITARTNIELTSENRLNSARLLFDHLAYALPIRNFTIETGGGGNWDDKAIEAICTRLGFQAKVSESVYRDVKRGLKDDLGPLGLVKKLRNELAHGSISFTECADDITVAWLVDIKDKTASYLREIVDIFANYIEAHEFLIPEKRPAQ